MNMPDNFANYDTKVLHIMYLMLSKVFMEFVNLLVSLNKLDFAKIDLEVQDIDVTLYFMY